jgi:hypothetical protein
VNADQFTMHAELAALFQAYQQGLRGGHGELVIQGIAACDYCKGDVKTIARALQLDSLTVHDADGCIIEFLSPKDLLPLSQGGKGWM